MAFSAPFCKLVSTLILFLSSNIGTRVGAHETIVNAQDFCIGDGWHDDTLALQALLLQPHSVVVIPSNMTVKTGPLRLASDLILQVDGTLQAWDAATNPSVFDVWPRLPPLDIYNTSEDGGHYLQYQALLYADKVTNLRITGRGTIDGKGDAWWNAFTDKNSKKVLKAGRPNLIQVVDSTNVEIDTVTLRDSPFWTVHPVSSRNIHIHHTTIRSRLYAPNVDGIDPDACQNALIEYNDISCGDDHIAIKAGRCGDATTPNQCTNPIWRYGLYQTTNITVRYNVFRQGMGIAVGSESSGGIRNVRIHDNVIGLCEFGSDNPSRGCGWGPALHIKTTMSRGGTIQDIVFRDNVVYNTSMFIFLEMDYQSGNDVPPPKDYTPTEVRNISFIRNQAMGMATGASFGCSAHDACHGIVVINNTVQNPKQTSPWSCHNVESYKVAGNVPLGLEECMADSMNHTASSSKA